MSGLKQYLLRRTNTKVLDSTAKWEKDERMIEVEG